MKKTWIVASVLVAVAAGAVLALRHWQVGPFAPVTHAATTKAEASPPPEEPIAAAGHVKLTGAQVKNAQIQAEFTVHFVREQCGFDWVGLDEEDVIRVDERAQLGREFDFCAEAEDERAGVDEV